MNTDGLRVESRKAKGLFSKCDRPNRYLRIWALGSGSDGSGLMAFGSNHVRPKQIGRSWGFGRAVREEGVAQGREWAVAGWAAGEDWTGLLGWFFWVPFLFYF